MKNYFLTAIILFFLPAFVFSQSDLPLKYAATITQQDLKNQLTIVASAQMEGRRTGTEGQRKAAAYIKGEFEKLGLKAPDSLQDYQQYYRFFKDTLLPKEFKIGKRKLEYEKDYVLLAGASKKEPFKSKEIVFAGYGIDDKIYNDYSGKDVKGKVVVILSGEPLIKNKNFASAINTGSHLYGMEKKALTAERRGAVAALFINTDWDSIPSSKAENADKVLLYSTESHLPAELTMALMSPIELRKIFGDDLATKIMTTARTQKPLNEIKIDRKVATKLVFKKIPIVGKASNVIGFVEGSDKKDEYVFLTAHYDHLGKIGDVIYYGADDDGSGTAAVIEMAQAFAKAKQDGISPRRTIVFMLFSGEEEGLLGSQFYSQHPVFPLEKTSVDLNADMIGRLDPNRKYAEKNYLYLVGNNKISSQLSPISEEINAKYSQLKLDYKYNTFNDPERLFYRSDHFNFARKGVPVIFYTSGLHTDYHKPSDTVDKINFDIMEKRVQFIFLTAWKIANMDEILKRDLPLPKEGM